MILTQSWSVKKSTVVALRMVVQDSELRAKAMDSVQHLNVMPYTICHHKETSDGGYIFDSMYVCSLTNEL